MVKIAILDSDKNFCDKIKKLIEEAKVITIASSPYFIEQDHAIKVLKELFNCDIIK